MWLNLVGIEGYGPQIDLKKKMKTIQKPSILVSHDMVVD